MTPTGRPGTDGPGAAVAPSRSIDRLIEIMAALRTPETGCPWDLEQDFASIAPYTIEEAYEVADAIARGDHDDLKDELGDLLLQVAFHARMAEEESRFDFGDVVAAITEKMIRRHPHVFGADAAGSGNAVSVKVQWEEIKAAEKNARAERPSANSTNDTSQPASLLDDVPDALPALMRAAKLQRRAARVGFDWPDPQQVLDKVREETAEVAAELARPTTDADRIEDEIGDVLFAVANLARHASVDPEAALRRTNRKFQTRFRAMEARCRADGTSLDALTLAEMEALWQAAKRSEREPGWDRV